MRGYDFGNGNVKEEYKCYFILRNPTKLVCSGNNG